VGVFTPTPPPPVMLPAAAGAQRWVGVRIPPPREETTPAAERAGRPGVWVGTPPQPPVTRPSAAARPHPEWVTGRRRLLVRLASRLLVALEPLAAADLAAALTLQTLQKCKKKSRASWAGVPPLLPLLP